ncbi:MAG: hypothetical protein HOO67_00920 [Candidatus Peribacteraceae bacterium]|nr:hypothetical protein [Candidatus Peribacteraceae bacterium]
MTSTRWFAVASQILFWLSNAALFITTSYCALIVTVLPAMGFPRSDGGMTLSKIPAFFPALTVLLVIASALYLSSTKRSSLLFRLFFAVELPLLLIGFGRVVFNMYPSTVLFLSVVILLSSAAIWYEILWGHRKTTFNKNMRPYFFVPYLASSILSGWVFLIWAFWVPYVGWQILSNLYLIREVPWQLIFGTWIAVPAMITGGYFFLSPALAFGMLAWETFQRKFPRKQLVVLGGILVVVGGTFILDTLEKRGPQSDLYEAARKLHIIVQAGVNTNPFTDEPEVREAVPFTHEELSGISNFNRLRGSTKSVYLAGLKYPINSRNTFDSQGALQTNAIRDAVRETYCSWEMTRVCGSISSAYELLFFPLMYTGDIVADRELAEKTYAYVFDGSLQNDEGDRIARLKKRSILGNIGWNAGWQSVEASALKKNDTLVHVDEARYEIAVNRPLGVYTNLITYTLRNTTSTQQEAFIEFLLPDAHAVITDLRLGLNLELPSSVAPRGAAKRVYERSMLNQIDPALLEQVGPRQYRLRVFPVPPTFKADAPGMQKVQLEFTAFIPPANMIPVTMPMTTRNLGIDRSTAIATVIKDAQGQDIPFARYGPLDIKGDSLIPLPPPDADNQRFAIEGPNRSVISFAAEMYPYEAPSVFFLDASASANTPDVRRFYKKLREEYKDTGTFYTYNFGVEELQPDADISFWGPTDTRALVRFLTQPPLAGKHIGIVTDDSNFELDATEATDIDYSAISKLKVMDVAVVGTAVPIFKNELTNAFAVTQETGTVRLLEGPTEAAEYGVNWLTGRASASVQMVNDPKWREAVEDLWAYHQGKGRLRGITNSDTWEKAAEEQTAIAYKAHIVNQFNSLIALQTEWQKQALERETHAEDKYRSDHDIGEVPDRVLFSQSSDEPGMYVLLVMLILLAPGILMISRRVRN